MSMVHKLLTGEVYLTRAEAEKLLQEKRITAMEYRSIAAFEEFEKATAEISKMIDELHRISVQLQEAQEKQSELLQFLLSNQESPSIINKYRLFSKEEIDRALEELPF